MRTIVCGEDRVCRMSEKNQDQMGSDPLPEDLMPLSEIRETSKSRPRKRRRTRKVLKGGKRLKRSSLKSKAKATRRRQRKRSTPIKRKSVKKIRKRTVRRRRR